MSDASSLAVVSGTPSSCVRAGGKRRRSLDKSGHDFLSLLLGESIFHLDGGSVADRTQFNPDASDIISERGFQICRSSFAIVALMISPGFSDLRSWHF